jgi:hypothetical protein
LGRISMKSSATFWTRFLKADEVSTSCQRRHQARHSHPKDRPLKQLTYVRHSKNPVIFRGRLVGLLVLGALTPTTPIAAQKTASPPAIDASPPSSWRVPPAELQALTFRELGPFRGGRVTTVTGVAQEPPTFYFGGTGGGVWKTESAGQAWTNISDGGIEVESIGAVAVAPSDPNVLYVGTGSDAIRGNVSTGRGVYRSDDDGETWRLFGAARGGPGTPCNPRSRQRRNRAAPRAAGPLQGRTALPARKICLAGDWTDPTDLDRRFTRPELQV